jgi:hypothetical protein
MKGDTAVWEERDNDEWGILSSELLAVWMDGQSQKTLVNLKMKLIDVGWKNIPCRSPHKNLSLLPQPHLDKNLKTNADREN